MKIVSTYILDDTDSELVRWICKGLTDNLLSQEELAKKIGVSKQSINNYLHGRQKLSRTVVIAMWWAFGMNDDLDELLKMLPEKD